MPRRGASHIICFRGASALYFPTLLPCLHCGGVSEQTAFTDISVATLPDPVCSAGAAVPVRDSAPAACVWVAAQDASISAAVSVRTVGDPLAPACVPLFMAGCKLCCFIIGLSI